MHSPTQPTNIATALRDLGVRDSTLTVAEKAKLDQEGYLFLHDVLNAGLVRKMTARVDELIAYERAHRIVEGQKEPGTDRVANLLEKDPMFDVCLTHPRLLAAIAHVLQGEFVSFGITARNSLPGGGHQDLHVDFKRGAVKPGDYWRCNSAWLLDDFTEHNGPTRIVPGTHRSRKVPKDEMTNPADPHPREIKVLAPAGTVIIFNSHTWHGGTINQTDRPRRVIHSYFRRPHPDDPAGPASFTPELLSRLSEAARYILNV
jgi:ectoine hydroxylase-related dioxygenase (phytanoyl-CoA dioxygenase family)